MPVSFLTSIDEFFPVLKGGKDPLGSDPENIYDGRVVRGGLFTPHEAFEEIKDCRAALRDGPDSDERSANYGFRLAIIPLR